MNHAVKIALVTLLIGNSLQNNCYATGFNNSNIAGKCQTISNHLRDLTRVSPNSYCIGDIESVANSLEQMGQKLAREKPEKILATIKYAELELKQIKNNRSYCAQFTPLVSPIIDEIKHTGHELEVFMNDYLTT